MKTIVCTGGSKGIGKAIVLKFLQEGFQVITCGRGKESLDQLIEETKEEFPDRLQTVIADVSKKEGVKTLFEFIQNKTSQVDVLVNNAGFFVPGSIWEEEESALEEMIESNLFSAYRLSKSLLPQMMKRKSGHVFNMCSVASIMAYPNGGSYSISKYAMLGLSKSLREEMKEYNIKVTSVLPGATYTSSWEGVDLPVDRFIPADDVAKMVWDVSQLSLSTCLEELVIRPQLGDI